MVDVLERDLSGLQRALTKRRQEQAASEQAVEVAREASRAILNQTRALQERIQEQDRGVARKTAQLNVLEGLQAKFEGFGEGAKAILGDQLMRWSPGTRYCCAQYTRAIETLLGPAMEALFVGKSDLASTSSAGSMQSNWGGLPRLTSTRVGTPRVGLPAHIVPASVVNVRDEALFGPAQRLLSGCYFAEDLAGVMDFWKAIPNSISFWWRPVRTDRRLQRLHLGGTTSGKS